MVQLFLLNDVSLEACDNSMEETALFYAVRSENVDVVKLLINAGCDVNAENRYHETPKMIAQGLDNPNIENLFPEDETIQCVPSTCTTYGSYKELVPTAFSELNVYVESKVILFVKSYFNFFQFYLRPQTSVRTRCLQHVSWNAFEES